MSDTVISTPASLRIEGELTIYRAAELCEVLKGRLADATGAEAIELDLSEVTEMDSAGLQLLLAAKKSARAAGRDLRLARCSVAVSELLATLSLDTHFADVSPPPSADSNS